MAGIKKITPAWDFDPVRRAIPEEQLCNTIWRMDETGGDTLQSGIVFRPDGTVSSEGDAGFGTWNRQQSFLYIYDARGRTAFVLAQSRPADGPEVTFEGPFLRDATRRFVLRAEAGPPAIPVVDDEMELRTKPLD